MKGVAILSGGADSATLVYHLIKSERHEVEALSFDYGQRHRRELESARAIAKALGIPHGVVDLSALRPLLASSALTGDNPVPHGHYMAETMRQTVVPNRNAIMLSVAWGVASSLKMDFVAYGAHGGDHFIYPDCRPAFVQAIESALRLATVDDRKPREGMQLLAPFLNIDKGEIVRLGLRLGVPYELTWTCYEGGSAPCGKCGACTERAAAFEYARAPDPALAKAA